MYPEGGLTLPELQPVPQDAFLEYPSRPFSSRLGDFWDSNPLSRAGDWVDNNASNIGLGMGLLGSGLQFADSFNTDRINRIQNPYRDEALNQYRTSIANQRGLRYDVSDQIGDIKSSGRSVDRWAQGNLSGPSRAATKLANRGVTLRGLNSTYGDRNRGDVGIQSTANQMGIGLADAYGRFGNEQAGYDNMYQDMNLRNRANVRRNRYGAISNLSDIFQGYGRDQQLLDLLPKLYPHSNI